MNRVDSVPKTEDTVKLVNKLNEIIQIINMNFDEISENLAALNSKEDK